DVQGYETQWQINVKNPTPAGNVITAQGNAGIVSQQTANGRPNDCRQPEHRSKQTDKLGAFTRCIHVGNDGNGTGKQRRSTNPFHRTEYNQLLHSIAQQWQRAELTAETTQCRT